MTIRVLLPFVLTLGLASQASRGELWTVNQPVIDMYAEPSADAPVVSQCLYGTNVESIEERPGWLRIRSPDGYLGWVDQTGLLPRPGRPYGTTPTVGRVWNLFASIYAEPDVTRRRPLLTVPFAVRLEVVSLPQAGERWVQVRLVDDRLAWIQRGDLSLRLEPLSVGEIIGVARRLVGLPYRWGGTSTYGFDCSGLTQLLCSLRGVLIPRDSGPQSRWEGMVDVSRAELEPGDLLFFGSSPDKVSHTGLYLGGGEFVHATTHGTPTVRIDRLDDPYWSELLVRCRRLLARPKSP